MDNETIESFAKYRLNKAKETLETAKMIFKGGKDFTSANNREYYAIFMQLGLSKKSWLLLASLI